MSSLSEEILSYLGVAEAIKHAEEEFESDEYLYDVLAHADADDDFEDFDTDEYLMHYGIKYRSGRYPYGSGEDPYQHGSDFLGRIDELKKSGFTYTDDKGVTWSGDNAIAKSMGLTSTEYRRQVSWANHEDKLRKIQTAKNFEREEKLGATEIGRRMGVSESTVRGWLKDTSSSNMDATIELVNFLGKQLQEKEMIEVGAGVEKQLGVTRTKLDTAIDYLCKAEGCNLYAGGISQITTKNQTTQNVLCKPGIPYKEIYNYDKVKDIFEYTSHDGGKTFDTFVYPKSMDSKRLKILLKDEVGPDGTKGVDKDGIIEIRPGVKDLSLGDARYAQVRILVDDSKYLKGMAVYSDNLPDGVDVLFNSNKESYDKALKSIGKDPDNPFGTTIKPTGQSYYEDENGNRQLSLINKCKDEGDWSEWKDALPSQFLSKQNKTMVEKQLSIAKADKLAEYESILELENPTIKKHLLGKFADGCDSAAVHLQAAPLPGQKYHVIIPVNTLKDDEVYAPNYPTGTKLALIRYPHAGTFEIPVLKVNNEHAPARKLLGPNVGDAIGINKNNADRLSGADFDGDTVMCIPTHDRGGKVHITATDPLKDLIGFDPQDAYKAHETKEDANGNIHYYRNGSEYPIMKNKGMEMGVISNLITDMTLKGANPDEMARAVKHSMVVIDAEKHKLDYKASELENDIASLKRIYQKKDDGGYGGAGTIISRAKGQYSVEKRQGSYKVNVKGSKDYDPNLPEGAKIWKLADDLYAPDQVKYDKDTGLRTLRTADGKRVTYNVKDKEEYAKYNPVKKKDEDGNVYYTNRDGDIVYKTKTNKQKSTKMGETQDARTLLSTEPHPVELLYADYANDMKALGNKARLEMVNTPNLKQDREAKIKYAAEIKSLDDKLNLAMSNAPVNRAVLRKANAEIKAKKAANPDMSAEDEKKIGQQAIRRYRAELGALTRKDRNVDITDREWEAIQAGAISDSKLRDILNNTDLDKLRARATPKSNNSGLSDAQVSRLKAMSGTYTNAQLAEKFGISPSQVSKYLKGGN